MGGIGSGRRSGYGRTTEDSRPLDIRRLHRKGLLMPGRRFGWQWTIGGRPVSDIQIRVEADEQVALAYRYRQHRNSVCENVKQVVYLDHTPCTYGGTRPWWLCPSCHRRVAVIYAAGKLYACRFCHHLPYACQHESYGDRAARRADKIRRRLRWKLGIFNPRGSKPKGMHWQTFWRLTARHEEYWGVTLAGLREQFGIKPMQ